MSRVVQIKRGWRLKDGKLVRCVKHLDASARARQHGSNRVRVGKRLRGMGQSMG
jgi:hypothetical protein